MLRLVHESRRVPKGQGVRRSLLARLLAASAVLLAPVALPASEVHAAAALRSGPLWVARYSGTWLDQVYAMALSPDGSKVFVTGKSTSQASYDAATVAYDSATGATLWVDRFEGATHGFDQGTTIAVSPDGSRVFVGGVTNGPPILGSADFLTLAYDAETGGRLWASTYDGPAHLGDAVHALAVSPDGSKVFVSGESDGDNFERDWLTIAYDAPSGTPLWHERLGSNGSANALAVSPDGTELFVSGSQVPPGFSDARATTLAYDAATGSRLWLSAYPGTGFGGDLAAVAVSGDGSRVFVTGNIDVAPYNYDYITLAYDTSTGSQTWVQQYTGPYYMDKAAAIVLSPDGSKVFVTGTSDTAAADQDFATLAYDASTGTEVWVQRFGNPFGEPDTASSVAVTPDGSTLFVTGSTYARSGWDYATVGYSAETGDSLGVRRFNGLRHQYDYGVAVAVSPDGSKAFVTGYSEELRSSSYDYVTLAYPVGRKGRR